MHLIVIFILNPKISKGGYSMLISKMTTTDLQKLYNAIQKNIDGSKTLEDAAQSFVTTIYNFLEDTIVLLRLFVTIKQNELPSNIQSFTKKLASTANVTLANDSYNLTLMGTMGVERDWHVRKRSQGHLGIPLPTKDFVQAIPMMSALLEQLGFDLGWIRGEPEIVARKMGRMAGTFYVGDAATALDSKKRKIIAAQDFVSQYSVKTVFGVGGGYTLTDKFLTVICFCREHIEKERAIWFQGFANLFKSETSSLVSNPSKFFST